MIAAISDRAERLYRTGEGTFRGGRCMAPEAAMREALALLARTEPMRPGYMLADHCYLGPIPDDGVRGLLADDPARAALAEALATFVAD